MTVTAVQVKQYKCHAFIFWQHRVFDSLDTVAIDSINVKFKKSQSANCADTQNYDKNYKTREY